MSLFKSWVQPTNTESLRRHQRLLSIEQHHGMYNNKLVGTLVTHKIITLSLVNFGLQLPQFLWIGNFTCATEMGAAVQPTGQQALAPFHRLTVWLNHNILSVDVLSHGIQQWPIAKRQGYFWLSLIGWCLSTKLKGHIPGTQPKAKQKKEKTGCDLFVPDFQTAIFCTLHFAFGKVHPPRPPKNLHVPSLQLF